VNDLPSQGRCLTAKPYNKTDFYSYRGITISIKLIRILKAKFYCNSEISVATKHFTVRLSVEQNRLLG